MAIVLNTVYQLELAYFPKKSLSSWCFHTFLFFLYLITENSFKNIALKSWPYVEMASWPAAYFGKNEAGVETT